MCRHTVVGMVMVTGGEVGAGRAAAGTAVASEPERLKLKRQRLAILVGADLHDSREGLDWFVAQAAALSPELVVFLGDFTTSGSLSFVSEVLRELRQLSPNTFVIPGNWDPREALSRMDTEAVDGLRHLHRHTVQLGGYLFAGLGGSMPTPVSTTPLEMPEETLTAPFTELLPADVWLLHNPVHGFGDRVNSGENAGSRRLREVYNKQAEPPLLVMNGHIHEAYGVSRHNHTTFVNPGSLQEMRAAWVVLDGRQTAAELLWGEGQ